MIRRGSLVMVGMFLLAGGGAALAAPAVFWASDPINPGETAIVTGADLNGVRNVMVSRLADGKAGAAGAGTRAEILQHSDNAIKFVIPPDFAAGVYRFVLDDGGTPVRGTLNAPTIYWNQGDAGTHATAGGWVRVMGRNIVRAPDAELELTDPSGRSLRIKPSASDLWNAVFPLPADLEPGTFRLKLWNGQGDTDTWRSAGTVEVTAAVERTLTLDAQQLGLDATGQRDVHDALQAALDQVARRGGGTVYLPRGYYKLTDGLAMPRNVRLKGESADLVSLVWPDTDHPPDALISGFSDFAVEDLTIAAGRHYDIINGGLPHAPGAGDGGNITLRGLRIRASSFFGHLSPSDAMGRLMDMRAHERDGVVAIQLAGSDLVVEDCDVRSSMSAFRLIRPTGARLSGNAFYNGRMGWYSISGADGLIFENNRIIGGDLQATGGGINTLFSNSSYSRNVLYRGNKLEGFFGWDREAMTTDGPGGFYFGPAAPVPGDASRLAMTGRIDGNLTDTPWPGATLFVLGGRGMGQFATVAGHDDTTLTLDTPLQVPPDASSVVTVVPTQAHYLILDNRFSDARIAVQIFGTALEHVVAGNVSERTDGFLNRAMFYKHVQPSWYNQFLGNHILSADPVKPSFLGVWGSQLAPSKQVLNYASVVRGNELKGNSYIDLRGASDTNPGLSDVVVELNTVENTDMGVRIDGGVRNELLRRNDFRGVTAQVKRFP